MDRHLEALRKEEEKRLKALRKEAKERLGSVLSIGGGLARLRGISDEEWAEAERESGQKARNPSDPISQMTRVQILVHLAMRWTLDDEERIRSELLRQRRAFYEAELTAQAARVGCPGKRALLREGPELKALNEASRADAESIVNTYNYDLARAILDIAEAEPRANRWVYAKRLQKWESERAAWKNEQIAHHTELSARAAALHDFYQYNRMRGMAVLRPEEAVCPVCQGWIERGETPLEVATANPPPYHVNCPHFWETDPERVSKTECAELWVG